MKVKIFKNGNVVCRRGLKTLISNKDTEVNGKVFEAGATIFQTFHYFLSSAVIMNCATLVLFAATLAFFVCATGRELRIYQDVIERISFSAVGLFASLLLYRTHFWKFFKKWH